MAKFDEILTPATNMASRLISLQLRRQAPVKSGALKRSIHVNVEREDLGDNISFTFTTEYLGYGIFTDLGTRPYGVSPEQRGEWNPNPGKGKGGIKPRFWNSISESVWQPIEDMLADAIAQSIQNEYDKI